MKMLVTGGGGFLGRRIVELLLEEGHEVRFIARGAYPEVVALGAEGRQVDLTNANAVAQAVQGCDVVFHVAARFGFSGSRDAFWAVNVQGTQNVINAMIEHNVPTLVYTSTPSVVGYKEDQEGIADAPYAKHHEGLYGETKAEAEQRVLAANGQKLQNRETLRTVALRPHLVFGPGDQKLIPTAVARARAGRLPIVGEGTNKVDLTYIDNAAWAHLDAAKALDSHTAPCAGKAYFISNDEPVVLWTWFNALLPQLGVNAINRKISLGTASAIGAVMEWAWRLLPLSGEPRMTRFMAAALARSHWYDMAPAKRDFGYHIRVDMTDATARTVAAFRHL